MSDSRDETAEFDDRTGLEILDRAGCEDVLGRVPIGRIVFVDDEGQPVALPVNYRWHDSTVVFRTLEGQKLFAAVANQRVSFEVDTWDPGTRTGESVLVKGKSEVVDQWADRERLEQIGLAPWSSEKWRTIWVRVVPVEVTGRRLSVDT